MINKHLKRIVSNLLPIAIGFWAIYSLYLILEVNYFPLTLLYMFYLLYIMATAVLCRNNIMQPAGISMLIGFLAFGSNIPLFANGLLAELAPIDPRTLTFALAVVILSQFAFLVGTLIKIDPKFSPLSILLHSKYKPIEISGLQIILLTLFVAVAGAFRIKFSIGAAKSVASIPLAGIFHYALLDGLLIILLWYLTSALKKKNLAYTIAMGIPLLGLTLTQAFLGWRGMIFRVGICVAVVFWYQKKIYQDERVRSFAWLFLLAFVGFFSIQLGHETRARATKADSEFAFNSFNFIEKVQVRSQGTTRLVAILERFDQKPWTNGWFFLRLKKQRETATNYVDRVVYGVKSFQKHSIGCSGPGAVYISAGLIGVAGVYFIWGLFFRGIYDNIGFESTSQTNMMAIAYYAALINLLVYTNSESFNLGAVKRLLVISSFAWFCNKFILQSKKKKQRRHTYIPADFPAR